jgi:hypothetical protein
MKRFWPKYTALLSLAALLAIGGCQPRTCSIVNLGHLERLCEDVTIQGKPCTIVHIYSDAPDYGWTDASGEGVACIDDVARAAVVYMRTNDSRYLPRIRGLLNFVLAMQAEDGTFYNFVHKDLTINRSGRTSEKSFGFWAARGYWALAAGYAFFKERDVEFASTLQAAYLRCLPQLDSLALAYGNYQNINGQSWPVWLINRHAADATSEFLLGAAEYLAAAREPALQQHAEKLAEGLMAMQVKTDSVMYGAFCSWPGYWHAWGNAQLQALAALSSMLGDRKRQDQAAIGGCFLAKLLAGHWLHEYDFAAGKAAAYPQIAYDIRTTALGFLQLYRTSGDEKYAILAGLAASWLTGNNISGEPLYDAGTGRCCDGIDPNGVNRNAGAESTIEALYTLVEIEKVPAAAAWLHALSPQKWGDAAWPLHADLQRTFIANNRSVTLIWRVHTLDFTVEYHAK